MPDGTVGRDSSIGIFSTVRLRPSLEFRRPRARSSAATDGVPGIRVAEAA